MASLFISYSRKDVDTARKLTEAFKGPDLDIWIGWEGIPPTVLMMPVRACSAI